MTPLSLFSRLALFAALTLLCQCASSKSKKTQVSAVLPETRVELPEQPTAKSQPKAAPAATPGPAVPSATDDYDDLDEYSVVEINDPFEGFNRGVFWVNDRLYLILCRPLSKGYEKLVPKPLRNGVFNALENVKYPVRLVNSLLTGRVDRAGLHTGKFLLNTVAGVGGLVRVTDRFPTLANLPEEDTGKTFAKWGIKHGPYIVIPFLGPSSLRDSIGLAADYALTPTNWGIYWYGKYDWTAIPPSVNTVRMLPSQLAIYDEAVRDAIDPYIAVRSGYVQFRADAVTK
jgi:phospholipid-binding lipoprotein MlaA